MTDLENRLTSKQRSHLRSLAHELRPVVHIGKGGLTRAVVDAAAEAFNTRELVKARVLEASPKDVRDVAYNLAERLDDDVQVVQVIGHVAILYRPHPDQPEIQLPE